MVGKCEQCGTLWVAELINFKYIYMENYWILQEYNKCVLPSLTWIIGLIINLISETTVMWKGGVHIYSTLKVSNNYLI